MIFPPAPIWPDVCKWAVPYRRLPAVTAALLSTPSLTFEPYDLSFSGQHLETTYFDTPEFVLRKARLNADHYLTLRLRCYHTAGAEPLYALSAKTEEAKWRVGVDPNLAQQMERNQGIDEALQTLLPPDLQARLIQLVPDPDRLLGLVTVCYRRYAVEDDANRLTLDCAIATDADKHLPFCVLEYKSRAQDEPPATVASLNLRPLKLSKFLWASCP